MVGTHTERGKSLRFLSPLTGVLSRGMVPRQSAMTARHLFLAAEANRRCALTITAVPQLPSA